MFINQFFGNVCASPFPFLVCVLYHSCDVDGLSLQVIDWIFWNCGSNFRIVVVGVVVGDVIFAFDVDFHDVEIV